jgi:hypothetical protein
MKAASKDNPTSTHMMRMRGLVRKELFQVIRDPSSIAIAFLMPVVLLLLFGYGVSLDAKHVPIAIVLEDKSPEATSFAAEFKGTEYFEPHSAPDIPTAEKEITLGKVKAIVNIRQDFTRTLSTYGAADIQVIIDGTDANYGRLVQGYINGAWSKWLEHTAQTDALPINIPVRVDPRIWFKPELSCPGPYRPHNDTHWSAPHRDGNDTRMGTRHYGGPPRYARQNAAHRLEQAHNLLFARRRQHAHFRCYGRLALSRPPSRLLSGPFRHIVPFHAHRAGHGPSDIEHNQEPVCRRSNCHNYHLFAGLPPVRLHFRHCKYAPRSPGHHTCYRRPLLRGYSANGFPGRQRRLHYHPQFPGPYRYGHSVFRFDSIKIKEKVGLILEFLQ